jgi:hypothetical protein
LLHKTPSLLKQTLLLLLLLLILGQAANVQAQTTATTIESLAVDIWPDYDRPSVLVLLTGILPADAALPATVTLPLPEDADLTAVARIGADDNLFADITFNESVPGEVTLTTPDPRFRIEYYMPYDLAGEERTFTFEWQADLTVTQLLVSIQQPVATAEMTTDPAVFSVTPRQDGFQYHNFSPQEIAAGERLSLDVSYSRSVSQLSAELLQPETTAETTTSNQPSETAPGTSLNWPMILLASGGVAVLAVGAWMMFGERIRSARQNGERTPIARKASPAKPRPTPAPAPKVEMETSEPQTPTFAQFCHQCGQKSDPNDRFCRSCGTRLKT